MYYQDELYTLQFARKAAYKYPRFRPHLDIIMVSNK
jgi:hypothetical protein